MIGFASCLCCRVVLGLPVTISAHIKTIAVRDLGRLAYAPALDIQRQVHQQVLDGADPVLLLVEHDPVVTVSRRRGAERHVLLSPPALAARGIDVQPTDRGGDVTYHGPGQLVAYPILRLADYSLNVGRYMRLLEQVVIETVAVFGIAAHRDRCAVGVWLSDGKLCAMGVRVKRNVTMHGLALNVDPDLGHFQTIVPCGLAQRQVTSMRQALGRCCPDMAAVKRALADAMRRNLHELSRRRAADQGSGRRTTKLGASRC
jgi:lipoyl(octanoyl) transferase